MGGAVCIASASNGDNIDATVGFYGVPDLSKIDVGKIKGPISAVFASKD